MKTPYTQVAKPVPGLVIAGKVRLDKLLGKGGMGSVWVGTHLGLDIPVAVKFMTGSAEAALSRFQREARAAAQIRSSNVVKIHDYGIDQGLPYIVMELLEGEDLAARIRRAGRLSLVDAEKILIPVARGLERAHEAKLVHRDLKPENVFLVREGDEEIPKILDFGIAKTLAVAEDAKDVTEEGTVLGTPYYLSPEQARGKTDIDHRADLWSLGVILFRMVMGRQPFEANAIGDLIVRICMDPVPRVVTIDPTLPPELDAFFDRALAKDPAMRFTSARELARAFSDIVRLAAPGVAPVMHSIPPSRSFDGAFDASGGFLASHTGRTGPLGATGPSTLGPATNASLIQAPAPSGGRGILIGAIAAALLLLVGGIAAFMMFGVKAAPTVETGSSKNTNAPAAAPPPPVPTSAPREAAAEPAKEIVLDEEGAAPPASASAAPGPLPATDAKTTKPLPSATTKKTRDLGY
ncbi:serine/threonine-protein kinase [Polyangium sp. y55x31]|uniref:serine/threonine-protein kinase n=1 Tax=Polyangium sp. y55x31 TaxID=3042688 RepID=UPI002482AB40|nr:serine/threonine-protein kinase [Polyangium sp. y55x31]MDI1482276.1 serine/threonine-protein kinase [Polyangium sp. y55x31]